MSFFTESQIEKIISHAFDAGDIAERFQKSGDFQISKKPDTSRVTCADIAVSKFINKKLTSDFPEIPIICEEGTLREADDVFWLIDPIDGTSSFIEGNTSFAVNIALVKDQRAVFGLIYSPSFEGGKMTYSDHEDKIILQNKTAQKIKLEAKKFNQDQLKIVTGPRVKDETIMRYIAQFHPDFMQNTIIEKIPSAVKFFRILENNADLYLHFRKSMEWDTASGQALIELMGGKVNTLSSNDNGFVVGDKVLYKKPDFANNHFIALIKKELANSEK